MSVFFILLTLHLFAFGVHKATIHRSHVHDSGGVFLAILYHKLVDEKNLDASEIIHAVQGKVDAKSRAFLFSIKGVKPKELIQRAEIRVKVVCSRGQHPNPDIPIRLGLYDMMDAKLISRAVLRKALPSWVVFPIHSDVIGRWLRSLNINRTRGVKIEVMRNTARENNTCPQVLVHGGNNSSHDEPFMVIHTNGARFHDLETSSFLRSHVPRNIQKKKKSTTGNPRSVYNHLCSRRSLRIKRQEIQAGDKVIAPASIAAFNCAGICNYTASPDIFSRHAIMRWHAMHRGQRVNVTAPCCVPTKFTSIKLITISENNHMILRSFEGLVVAECGCR